MRFDQNLQLVKNLVHEVIPYKKEIFLFGSRAKGTSRKNSDYDILVIVKGKNLDRKELIRFQSRIKRLCAKSGLDTDLIVRDSLYAESIKNFPGNIINSALTSGIRI